MTQFSCSLWWLNQSCTLKTSLSNLDHIWAVIYTYTYMHTCIYISNTTQTPSYTWQIWRNIMARWKTMMWQNQFCSPYEENAFEWGVTLVWTVTFTDKTFDLNWHKLKFIVLYAKNIPIGVLSYGVCFFVI